MEDKPKTEQESKDDEGEMISNWDETVETFDELNLKPELLRGIYGYGFEKPSAIQQKAILPIIKQRDVIAQAQSGTGKTAAFAIGSLQLVDVSKDEGLIVSRHERTRNLRKKLKENPYKFYKEYYLKEDE